MRLWVKVGQVMAGLLVSGASQVGAAPVELAVFPQEERFQDLDDRLFSLGWSVTGTFAYLLVHANEAADERLWEAWVLDPGKGEAEQLHQVRVDATWGIDRFWEEQGAAVTNLLESNGVRVVEGDGVPILHRFPTATGRFRGFYQEAIVDIERGKDPLFDYNGIRTWSVRLMQNGEMIKEIDREEFVQFYPLTGAVAGALVSPSGEEMVVVLAMTQRGYEGPPHPRKLRLVGTTIGERF